MWNVPRSPCSWGSCMAHATRQCDSLRASATTHSRLWLSQGCDGTSQGSSGMSQDRFKPNHYVLTTRIAAGAVRLFHRARTCHTTTATSPSVFMGAWGLVFASMQGCNAPKTTHPHKKNNRNQGVILTPCRNTFFLSSQGVLTYLGVGGLRDMAALYSVCYQIHMWTVPRSPLGSHTQKFVSFF